MGKGDFLEFFLEEDSKLFMDIAKALSKSFEENSQVLLSNNCKDKLKFNVLLCKYLQKKKKKIIYVTFNKPALFLLEKFKKYDISESDIFIIDMISNLVGFYLEKERKKNFDHVVYFFQSPKGLIDLNKYIEKLIKQELPGSVCVVIDSLTTLAAYNTLENITRFLQSFSLTLRGLNACCVVLVNKNTDKNILAIAQDVFDCFVEI